MKSIKEILSSHGYDSIEAVPTDTYAEISVEGYEDLTIEKIAPNRLSVSHSYTQRGDIMRDPEIVFKVTDGEEWIAVMYQQDNIGAFQQDDSGIESATTFAHNLWDSNLQSQGFVEAAKNKESLFN